MDETDRQTDRQRQRDTETVKTQRERERDKARQRERETETVRDKVRERETERERERERERETDRQTETEKQRQKDRESLSPITQYVPFKHFVCQSRKVFLFFVVGIFFSVSFFSLETNNFEIQNLVRITVCASLDLPNECKTYSVRVRECVCVSECVYALWK